jgi:hypothetical protein
VARRDLSSMYVTGMIYERPCFSGKYRGFLRKFFITRNKNMKGSSGNFS